MPPKGKRQLSGKGSTASATKKRVFKVADDVDEVLAKCRQLREQIRQKAKKQQDRIKRIADIDHLSDDSSTFDSDEEYKESDKKVKKEKAKTKPKISLDILKGKSIVEVSEMSSTEVVEAIEAIAIRIANQVLMKKGFSMEIPSRSSSNQVYIKELDRIVLGDKKGTRSFLNAKEARKSAITTRVMQLLHTVLLKKIHITKRDLFYTDVKLFVDQSESDGVLDDIATMVGCTRSNLHVVASDKGLVVGRITFIEDGDYIDCVSETQFLTKKTLTSESWN